MSNFKHVIFGALMIFPMLGTSFYIHSFSLAPFSVFGYFFACLYLLFCNSKINDALFLVGGVVCLSLLSALVSAIFIFLDGFEFRVNTFFGVVLGVLYFLALKELFYKLQPTQLNRLLLGAIVIVLAFFYIQFFSYFLFGYDVDFMMPVTGEAQRLDGYVQETSFGLFKRVAGLFAEPAVHGYVVNVILIALCLRRSLPMPIFVLGIASVWLSFSASGILLSLMPIALYLVFASRFVKVVVATVAFLVILLFSEDFYMVFNQQIERISHIADDASGADRLRFLDYFLANLDHLFFGFGIFTDIREVVPPSNFFVSVVYALGLPSALLFVAILVGFVRRYVKGLRFWIFILYGVLLNFPISSPFFWLNFSIMFMGVMIFDRSSCQGLGAKQKSSIKGAI